VHTIILISCAVRDLFAMLGIQSMAMPRPVLYYHVEWHLSAHDGMLATIVVSYFVRLVVCCLW